jgi:hypothetical protein
MLTRSLVSAVQLLHPSSIVHFSKTMAGALPRRPIVSRDDENFIATPLTSPEAMEAPFKDRLVWIRRNKDINNKNNYNDWWPAVYSISHNQAMRDFGHSMTKLVKMQAALKMLGEQRTNNKIPVAVPLTGKDRPVTRLEAISVVDGSNDNESDTLRRDFLGESYIQDFSERNACSKNDKEECRACLQDWKSWSNKLF